MRDFIDYVWEICIAAILVVILINIVGLRTRVEAKLVTVENVIETTETNIKPLTILNPVKPEITYENTLKAKLTRNKNAFTCPFCETHLVVWASSGETAVARYNCPNCGFTTFEAHVNIPDKDAAIAELDRLIIKYCTEED